MNLAFFSNAQRDRTKFGVGNIFEDPIIESVAQAGRNPAAPPAFERRS